MLLFFAEALPQTPNRGKTLHHAGERVYDLRTNARFWWRAPLAELHLRTALGSAATIRKWPVTRCTSLEVRESERRRKTAALAFYREYIRDTGFDSLWTSSWLKDNDSVGPPTCQTRKFWQPEAVRRLAAKHCAETGWFDAGIGRGAMKPRRRKSLLADGVGMGLENIHLEEMEAAINVDAAGR